MSDRLARFVVQRPRAVLLVAALLALALAPIVVKLRLDTDVVSLIPQTDESARAFSRFSRAFGGDAPLVILVESKDPAELAAFTDRYAEALHKSPRLQDVRHRLPAEAALFFRDHFLLLLDDAELDLLAKKLEPDALTKQASRLRALLSAPGGSALAPLFTADPLELLPEVGKRLSGGLPVDATSGYFKSPDGGAMLLFARPHAQPSDIEASRALLDEASALAAQLGADGTQLKVSFTGAAAYSVAYRDWLHRDMTLSTLVSALAVLLLFGLFFRVLRVLVPVAVSLAFGLIGTAAFAVLVYGRLSAVALSFGTLLIAIGIDLPIQLYNRLGEERAAPNPDRALERTLAHLLGPSLLATLGPMLVFFACGMSEYRGLSELGVLAGAGLGFNFLAMVTIFPALLAALPASWSNRASPPSQDGLGARLAHALVRRPRVVLSLAALVTIAAIPLAMRVRVEDRLISIHPRAMPPVQVEAEIGKRFGDRGRPIVVLLEETDPERALERGDAWQQALAPLKRSGELRGAQSISTLFSARTTQDARRRALATRLPTDAAARLEAALTQAGFDASAFAPFLDQLARGPAPIELARAAEHGLDFLVRSHVFDSTQGRILAIYLFASDGKEDALVASAEQIARTQGGVVTGTAALERSLSSLVKHDTRRMTIVSTIAVLALLFLAYRRARLFIATALPLLSAWILFAAALALFDLPLNLFNLLAVPLVIGYGIDDHVFLVGRYAEDPARGAAHALASSGRAIVLTSLSTMAGFFGLAVARFDGLRSFGAAGTLAVLCCLVAALALSPALLALPWWNRSRSGSPPPPSYDSTT